jgi:protein TIF31
VKGKTKGGLPPIQIQPPSMGSVLDMLNIINGILFVQISQQVTVLFYSCSFAVGF